MEKSAEKFYLTQNGKPVGPWSLPDILSNLKGQNISWTDYLYDESRKDWVLLMDHPVLVPHFREMAHAPTTSSVPKQNPKPSGPEVQLSREKEWFALRGDNKYGPFTHVELLKMLQDKQLFEFDYVWNVRLSNWKRVAECDEFKPETVNALRESGLPEVGEVFFRRRHARAEYGASLVVHNNRQVWKAESLEISPGGCGLMIDNDLIEPGQSLFLHFKAGDGVPPFNAICEVVSKQAPKHGQAWSKYGVKFTSISRQVQLAIKEYTKKAA